MCSRRNLKKTKLRSRLADVTLHINLLAGVICHNPHMELDALLTELSNDRLTAVALPLFILAIALEALFSWRTHRDLYAGRDFLTSMSMLIFSAIVDFAPKVAAFIIFYHLHEWSPLRDVVERQAWAWVFLFFLDDLIYYWFHRANHEVRLFWAGHVPHHSSVKLNFGTALRQGVGERIHKYVFWLPLPLLGFDPLMIFTIISLNLIYQFWVHTEHVGELGVIEKIMVTPSNHRVHHAKNPMYIDKNYGGVFILWDRLFGTYQPELTDQPCRYGITRQLQSWNPVWANVHAWLDTAQQSWQTPRLSDKIKVWFKSPAWDAPGIASTPADWQAAKFQPVTSRYGAVTSFIGFWLHVGAAFVLLSFARELSQPLVLATTAWLTFGFCVQGFVMEGRRSAVWFEWLRLVLGTALLMWLALPEIYANLGIAYLLICAALNLGLLKTTQSADRLQSPG